MTPEYRDPLGLISSPENPADDEECRKCPFLDLVCGPDYVDTTKILYGTGRPDNIPRGVITSGTSSGVNLYAKKYQEEGRSFLRRYFMYHRRYERHGKGKKGRNRK